MNRSLYRTRIKFCGMTRAGDIRLAGELGVDAVGFIFAHGSPRRVAPAEARAMRQATAPMVDVVALFRNNSKEEVREVVRTVRPTCCSSMAKKTTPSAAALICPISRRCRWALPA